MSRGVGMSDCCLSGFVHSGTPSGREDTIGGLPTYVAEPGDKYTSKSLVFLTDIFGWQFKNIRLLADNYAKAGFTVYVPDVLSGDSLPVEFLQSVEPPLKVRDNMGIVDKTKATADVAATFGPWLIKHREAVSEPIISGFINTVRQIPGTDKIGAVGFCWGGRYAILQAHGRKEGSVGGVDAAVAFHPSLVTVPGDFDAVSKPLFIGAGDKDSLLDMKTVWQISELLEKKKEEVPAEVKTYEGQVHGFALRSDWSSDKDREAMDQAEKDGIAWLKKYL